MLGLALLPGTGFGYGDGPPAGHTGGFGEPDCGACHVAPAAEAEAGELTIEGLPERYRPGATYTVTITLGAPGMNAGGVSAAARTGAGGQAGRWRPLDGLEVVGKSGVDYLRHTSPARAPTARWRADWIAPCGCAGPVLLHVAGNAANDDDSEFGDRVVTRAVEVAAPLNCLE